MSESANLLTQFVFEARVACDPVVVIGDAKNGKRQLVPITGGEFAGPTICGQVLPGGADWQLVRPDGVLEIVARYTIQTDDGINISVINRGIAVYPPATENVYVRTTPEFDAPRASSYAWMNKCIFVGTVEPITRSPLVVSVKVFKVL
jgi:hypothetical protein